MKVEIKPIRTESDYENALKLIDSLWDSKPNSPNYDSFRESDMWQ